MDKINYELRDLFKVDSGERLRHLERSLKQLERRPDDGAAAERLLLETRGLKDVARILGLSGLEDASRCLEELLEMMSKVEGGVPSTCFKTLFDAVDIIRELRRGVLGEEAVDNGARRRILLAEDSNGVRTWEQRFLEGAGYDVTAAVDGAEALQKFGMDRFDGVVCDVQIPRLDGFQVTKEIRKDEKNAGICIVLVSSLASSEGRKRGIAAGADAYLPKSSFSERLLLATLQKLWGPGRNSGTAT